MTTPYTPAKAAPKKKKGGCMKWGAGIIGVIVAISIFSSLGEDSDDTTTASLDRDVTTSVSQAAEYPDSPAAEAAPEAAPVAAEPDNSVPTEYRSALRQADTYANSMHMSRQGLYDQLTSQYGGQFTAEAAQYAVDNVTADWNANALEKAESYSDSMHMSKLGVYDQLISEYGEQFTPEQAQYAIDTIDADWNANALEKARSYQESMNMSPGAIYDQLISSYGEQFTAAEADFAIANL